MIPEKQQRVSIPASSRLAIRVYHYFGLVNGLAITF